jgi:hypothetical protein
VFQIETFTFYVNTKKYFAHVLVMKTIIYTYENHKPIFFELDRYYLLRSPKDLSHLVDKLLDIDAVTHPEPKELRYPVVLELRAGFTPVLEIVSLSTLKASKRSLKKIIKQLNQD